MQQYPNNFMYLIKKCIKKSVYNYKSQKPYNNELML